MAQAKVTDFFNARKRTGDLHSSKRRKIETTIEEDISTQKVPQGGARTRRGRSKQCPKNLKVPTGARSTTVTAEEAVPRAGIGDHTPEIVPQISAACDDHHGSTPLTPTKRPSTAEKSIQAKRSRSAKSVRKDLLTDLNKTPDAYDFSRYAKSEKSKSARKKLVMKRKLPSPQNCPLRVPESLSPKEVSVTLEIRSIYTYKFC